MPVSIKITSHNIYNITNWTLNIGVYIGAASVHYHMISSASRGLFKRAISCSGSAIGSWGHKNGPQNHIAELTHLGKNGGKT